MDFWTEIVKSQGFSVAGLAFLLLWFLQREKRRDAEILARETKRDEETQRRELALVTRIEKTEDFIKTRFMDALGQSAQALTNNTNALKNLEDTLHNRPCMNYVPQK
jgi:hypothetical protein